MEEIQCHYCHKILTDPVTIPCSHSYCLQCIRAVFRKDNLCLVCQQPFGRPFKVNEELKKRVEYLKHQQELSTQVSDVIIEEKQYTTLLSLPDDTLMELVRRNDEMNCLLARTCKKMRDICNRDEVWLQKIYEINPEFKHKVGMRWKDEYVSLVTKRHCYLTPGIENRTSKTIYISDKRLSVVENLSKSKDILFHDNQSLFLMNTDLNIKKIEFPFDYISIRKICQKDGYLSIITNNSYFKYDYINECIITSFTPTSPIVEMLCGINDYLILNHNVIVFTDSNQVSENVYIQSEITGAMIYQNIPIIIGTFMGNSFVRTLKEDGSELADYDFEDEEDRLNVAQLRGGFFFGHQNVYQPITIINNIVYCGNKMWIPGEYIIKPRIEMTEKLIPVERNGKYQFTIRLLGNRLTIDKKEFLIETGINCWVVDELHNRILLLSKLTKKIYIYHFKKGLVYSFPVAFDDDEGIETFSFNPQTYQLFVFFTNSIRVIQFGK